ncbi:response regulator transcription factor [Brevundimonas poindexterae]|uniref:response regulator transcription factor n=1 Tax=Brevundimonas poindexterae TaxID=74325 RepID=UPI001CFD3CCC|nr:LuxR C-terminal-related transcriptional regulator [Brevundimonas poindexterae]
MIRTIATAALVLAGGALLLTWLEIQKATRVIAPEIHVAVVAAVFALGGLWCGWWLATRRHGPRFVLNVAAVQSLGLTGQEMRVLTALAAGGANKDIARALGLSPNTVKTHLAHLFAKLEAGTRTEAVGRARDLGLIP